MKKRTRVALLLGTTLLCLRTTHASIPNNDNPTTFLGPNLKLGYASPINDTTAYYVAGEAGIKNFRIGGTIGLRIADNQRVKLSVEYLWQKINYPFFSGDREQWMQQPAIGADYRYDLLGCDYNPQLGINVYASHALSRTLSTVEGSFINSQGMTQGFIDRRRLAGSNVKGFSPNATVQPWKGGTVGVEINYDHVRYNNYNPPNENAFGFGGTVRLTQAVSQDVAVGASAAIRQPFNNYAANIVWSNVPYLCRFILGVDGNYTAGKNTLPSTYDVSLSANYSIDPPPATTPAQRDAAVGLIAWASKPAVYMPEVLVISDKSIN